MGMRPLFASTRASRAWHISSGRTAHLRFRGDDHISPGFPGAPAPGSRAMAANDRTRPIVCQFRQQQLFNATALSFREAWGTFPAQPDPVGSRVVAARVSPAGLASHGEARNASRHGDLSRRSAHAKPEAERGAGSPKGEAGEHEKLKTQNYPKGGRVEQEFFSPARQPDGSAYGRFEISAQLFKSFTVRYDPGKPVSQFPSENNEKIVKTHCCPVVFSNFWLTDLFK